MNDFIEKNIGLMIVLVIIAVSFGGAVEIFPLLSQKSVNEPIAGLKPLTPLELEGRDIYIREGCTTCHSQMIRPLRAEVERYGHYSVAGELVYDHPFVFGSKRTGPDLARVGGLYSDDWHRVHLIDPRAVVPGSIMPAYPWLFERPVNTAKLPKKLAALRRVGVPYSDEDIANAANGLENSTEGDAVIAYLQQLGILITEKR
jgi:cytochrome c oxidase cbb3-type subunit II